MRNGVLFLWILFTAGLAAQTDGLGPKLLAAIRKGDVSAVHELLRDNADPNSHDETGASALMYAAAFSSPECMRLLITKGADVDGVNQVHATALMWASPEPEKVKLLIASPVGLIVRSTSSPFWKAETLRCFGSRRSISASRPLPNRTRAVRPGTTVTCWRFISQYPFHLNTGRNVSASLGPTCLQTGTGGCNVSVPRTSWT